MQMAGLPVGRPRDLLPETTLDAFVDQLAHGKTPSQVATALHPHDKRAARRTRNILEKELTYNPDLAEKIAQRARRIMLVGLLPATQALMDRAARGRPDAIKLAFEASGFHNPKVQHEHSGEIKVSLDMPRPKFAGDDDEAVVDAEVVED